MIRGALIDMDGTLYDSMPLHADAWSRVVKDIGFEIPRDEFFLYEGMTGEATINLLAKRELGKEFSKEECSRFYELKIRYFKELKEPPVINGAVETLQFLTDHGIICILVTGSGQSSLLDRLDKDFPGVFPASMRVTSRDVKKGKPDPEPFIKGMEKAGLSPWECIAIDNAPLGVKSAAASGAYTVGVVTGPIPSDELKKGGANIVVPSMNACFEFLRENLKKL
ncbi:MAG: HAD family phosphatase [Muribaculaceae bacterium]|nr:HAD family phosphatase [Muribaculaceae bacterium]